MSFKKLALAFIKSLALLVFVATVSLETPVAYRGYMRGIAENNVVRIVGMDGMGTGFHVRTDDGRVYILTNRHVCRMTGPLTVEHYGSKVGTIKKIVKISEEHDLCVMEALDGVKGISIGSDAINGDAVYTLGHPRGDALNVASGEKFDEKEIKVADTFEEDGSCKGEIIETGFFGTFCIMSRVAVQISAPTYPGNSGSPVVNKWGNLVGVIFAGSQQVENQGFYVPLSYVKAFLSSIK